MARRGFTLVEMLIVVALLGVLAAIAVPMYRGYIQSARVSEAKSNLETIRLLEEQFYADNKTFAEGSYTELDQSLQTVLTGFQPGPAADMNYDYSVAYVGGDDQTFLATATPRVGKASGGALTVDHNNDRTGW